MGQWGGHSWFPLKKYCHTGYRWLHSSPAATVKANNSGRWKHYVFPWRAWLRVVTSLCTTGLHQPTTSETTVTSLESSALNASLLKLSASGRLLIGNDNVTNLLRSVIACCRVETCCAIQSWHTIFSSVHDYLAVFLILRYDCPAVYGSTLETCCTLLLHDELAAGLCLSVKAEEKKPSCQMKPVLWISVPICIPKITSPIHFSPYPHVTPIIPSPPCFTHAA